MRNLFHDSGERNHKLLYLLIAFLIVVNAWIIIRSWLQGSTSTIADTQEEKIDAYWAVTLDTGQIFYGKIEKVDEKSITLTSAFYYQPGVSSANTESIRITKVGTELHKPKDLVYLNRSHVVSRQVLIQDSRVVKAINTYEGE